MDEFLSHCFVALVAGMLAFVIGMAVATGMMRREAIGHNAATYVITDPISGETKFKWNNE